MTRELGLMCAMAGSLLIGLIGTWSLWRVRQLLAVLPLVEGRLDTVSHSLTLLTDTTEACFKALAVRLETTQPARPATASHRPPRRAASAGTEPSRRATAPVREPGKNAARKNAARKNAVARTPARRTTPRPPGRKPQRPPPAASGQPDWLPQKTVAARATKAKPRQRRVLAAGASAESTTEIAARESLAQGEVALRLHLSRQLDPRHAALS